MLTPDPLKGEAPQLFKPTQIRTTIAPNTFTAQDAGIILKSKKKTNSGTEYYSRNTQIQLSKYLEKTLSYGFITVHNEQHSHTGSNPYNHLRIGLHDHLLNLSPLFNRDWFIQTFINFFGNPCYVLTQ